MNIFLGYYKLTKLITTLRLRLRAGPGAGAGSSALPWRHMRFQHCQLPLLGLHKEIERGNEEAGLAWPGLVLCIDLYKCCAIRTWLLRLRFLLWNYEAINMKFSTFISVVKCRATMLLLASRCCYH